MEPLKPGDLLIVDESIEASLRVVEVLGAGETTYCGPEERRYKLVDLYEKRIEILGHDELAEGLRVQEVPLALVRV